MEGILNADYWRPKYVFIKFMNVLSHAWLVDYMSQKFMFTSFL